MSIWDEPLTKDEYLRRLFEAKAEQRKKDAALSFEEKIEIVLALQDASAAFREAPAAETIGTRPAEKKVQASIPADWLKDFDAAARRPLALRLKYAFIHTYKPVLDDAPFRAFDTMADYRDWCERNLPSWLGYGRV